jgi:dephospho-CoA kinase
VSPEPRDRLPVIGLVGGIGAGKSRVAHALASLGCVVSDSDSRAKALLLRADIRATLVQWWGGCILDPQGQIDRAAVARIIFADPAQRQRLEQLIHPILKLEREVEHERARLAHARAFVIDAPLLFEAGLDAECDAILFVDAPEAVRLARVQATRGWDAAELHRRQAAQWPLERKRAAADAVIENDAAPEALDARVAEALHRILADWSAGR